RQPSTRRLRRGTHAFEFGHVYSIADFGFWILDWEGRRDWKPLNPAISLPNPKSAIQNPSRENQVVAVDDDGAVGVAEAFADTVRVAALDAADVFAVVAGDAAAQLAAVGAENLDRVAALEAAFDRADARGQEAAAAHAQRVGGAGVDVQAARGDGAGVDPALAVLQRRLQRPEARADGLALGDAQ